MRVSRPALAQVFVSSVVLGLLRRAVRHDAVRRVGAILLLLAVLGIVSKPAAAQSEPYVFQTISLPAPYAGGVKAVNGSGQMVGNYFDSSGYSHGFLYSQGQFTTIDVSGANGGTEAMDINDHGQVVGFYVTVTPYPNTVRSTHAFLWSAGQLTLIPDYSGAFRNEPASINNAGAVVGWWCCLNDDNEAGGFLYANGGYTQINYPGTSPSCAAQYGSYCDTYPRGINDAGQVVGIYTLPNETGSHAFLLSGGQPSNIDPPGQNCAAFQSECAAYGISGAGTVIISAGFGNAVTSFVLNGGKLTPFAYPNASSTVVTKINSQGWILGSSNVAGQFLAIPAALVDPITGDPATSLLSTNGPKLTSDPQLLGAKTRGRAVQGVAADGVTEVVVRIPAVNAGDQFSLTLINDQQSPSDSPAEDGALGNPGDTTFSQSQVTVSAQEVTQSDGSQMPIAFAVYRAPLDFVRQLSDTSYKTGTCGAVTNGDDNLKCRSVSLKIQNQTQGTTGTLPITILRPPLVMVHGLWDNWQTWNNFSPLVSGNTVDPRFSVERVNYETPLESEVIATDPFFPIKVQNRILANSLGFAYNARNVLSQISQWVKSFKGGNNPAGVGAAAVQADIVAHSMGGDITRTIVLQPSFLGNETFGQGNIHKVITIDTPHLGSELAIQLLSPQEKEGCLQNLLANHQKFPLNVVNLSDGTFWNGAMADLQGDDTTGQLSPALQQLSGPIFHPLPTALIAGIYTNFAALDSSPTAFVLRNSPWPMFGCRQDPLAQKLTSTGWPQIFHGNPNDAIVSENSQLNGLIPDPGSQFFGYVHSSGTTNLGFAGPGMLDAGPVPTQVISLLNTPWTNSIYYHLLGP